MGLYGRVARLGLSLHRFASRLVMREGWVSVTPGSMGACALALDLFGLDRVDPGCWLSPVWVYVVGLSEADLHAAAQLLSERGLTLGGQRVA